MARNNRTIAILLIFCLLSGSMSLLTGCTADAVELPTEEPASSGTWGITAAGPVATSAVAVSAVEDSAESLDMLNGSDTPLADALISSAAISAAMDQYGIDADSTAAQALRMINSTYAERLSQDQKDDLLVFLFEGAGENQDPAERKDAMCVVVQGGEILYLSTCCSTIPDYPFSPWKNDGSDVPTLCSGIYAFDTVNHNGIYAALRVREDRVIRFHDDTEFYADVSNNESIQVHRRGHEENSPDNEVWANSIGCLLVGHAGTEPTDDYATFARAVGILNEGATGRTPYQNVSYGTLVVDRSLGADYLRSVGYSDEAIAAIEGE
jgi:hypothetical protein